MNNFIIISRTYAETTPESAEIGDFSDTGFITEYEEVSFRELVDLLSVHAYASCSPNDFSVHTWYSTDFFIADYSTNTDREESVHFHRANTPNASKYWKYAAQIAQYKNKKYFTIN